MNIHKVPTKSGKLALIASMSEEEYREMDDNSQGLCLACGEVADGVEPDARKYACEACEEERVYGAQELLMMGRIEITV